MPSTPQVQSGGSFDVDYSVVGPNEKIIMENQKERQGDFVFSATEAGEYRFCFNNEMSTFAEKLVDFEITVTYFPPPPPPFAPLFFSYFLFGRIIAEQPFRNEIGRKRTPGPTPEQTRHVARTNQLAGRKYGQDIRAVVDDQSESEIFPDEGESEFQHGAEYGEEDFQR